MVLAESQFKFCHWLDSNRVILVSDVTALPTAPQRLPNKLGIFAGRVFANRKQSEEINYQLHTEPISCKLRQREWE